MSRLGVPILVLGGPTAAGKTELAVRIAEQVGGEIISADSRQIYRHLLIGTARPDEGELRGIPCHLVNYLDPNDGYSAADFRRDAHKIIHEVFSRGRLPIVVGGTGLYIRVLLGGIIDIPRVNPELRSRLQREAIERGAEFLYGRLVELDPQTAACTPVGNMQRIIRALEIAIVTGEPPSQIRKRHSFRERKFRYRYFVLKMDRDVLNRRIEARLQAMLDAGLVEEVRSLLAMGYDEQSPAMTSVGYRQLLSYLRGEMTLREAVHLILRDTRRYAKRQRIWFRGEDSAVHLAYTTEGDRGLAEQVIQIAAKELSSE